VAALNDETKILMLTYSDLETALKRVPLEQLPRMYELILAYTEWPFEASPAAMEADDREWDQQFAAEASQRFFECMAAEARAEIASGATEPLEQLLAEDKAHEGAFRFSW
jgi:hypothetical protein